MKPDIEKVFRDSSEEVIFSDNGEKYVFLQKNYYCKLKEIEEKCDSNSEFIEALLFNIYSGEDYINVISNKSYQRILNRLSCHGTDKASDKTCVHFLKKAEEKLNTTFLLKQDVNNANENYYVAMLVYQLIEMIVSTDVFNYIQNTKNSKYKCYVNHLEMIEKNIESIYEAQEEEYEIWKQILLPLKNMILLCEFPGIEDGIWIEFNKNLMYYDCVFSIADRYEEYVKLVLPIKERFAFDLGINKEQFDEAIKNKKKYFKEMGVVRDDDWNEIKQSFQRDVKKTYKEIIEKKFNVSI